MKLYNNTYSPHAKRPRVVAHELGVKLETQTIDFAKGENRAPEYLAKNPMGKVPTYEEPGFVLWESPAIAWYLATKNPSKGLVPADPQRQADALRWILWNAAHYEGAINTVGFERLVKPSSGGTPDQPTIDAATKTFERYAPVLNGALEGKQWLLGDTFTIADVILGTTTEFGVAAKLDFTRFPHLTAWLTRLQARPSWNA